MIGFMNCNKVCFLSLNTGHVEDLIIVNFHRFRSFAMPFSWSGSPRPRPTHIWGWGTNVTEYKLYESQCSPRYRFSHIQYSESLTPSQRGTLKITKSWDYSGCFSLMSPRTYYQIISFKQRDIRTAYTTCGACRYNQPRYDNYSTICTLC